jgi:hypothetical protein
MKPADFTTALSTPQVRERIVESGELSSERLNHLKSQDFWAFDGAGVAVWGQRPK